jgi:hypothetical protein
MKKYILTMALIVISMITNAQTAPFPSFKKMKSQAEKGNPEAALQLADYYYSIQSYSEAVTYYLIASNANIPKAQFMLGRLKEKGVDSKINGFGSETDLSNASNYYNHNSDYWYKLAENNGYTKESYLSDFANRGNYAQGDYRNDIAFQEKVSTKRAEQILKNDAKREKIERKERLIKFERENGIVHNGWILGGLAQGLQESAATIKQQGAEYDAMSRGTTVAAEKAKALRDAQFYEALNAAEKNSNSNSSSSISSSTSTSSNGNSSSSNSSSGNASNGNSSSNNSSSGNVSNGNSSDKSSSSTSSSSNSSNGVLTLTAVEAIGWDGYTAKEREENIKKQQAHDLQIAKENKISEQAQIDAEKKRKAKQAEEDRKLKERLGPHTGNSIAK